MWHPASLLLTWLSFALILQWAHFPLLVALALTSVLLAGRFAYERSRTLLWRSRWLLLSLGILFFFATPGEYLPGIWGSMGLTYEGMQHGSEQLSRLLAMLASLALLHQRLGTQGLLAGFYWLLRPFAWRVTTVVRLMLVLEFVEQKRQIGWREWLVPQSGLEPGIDTLVPDYFNLSMPPLHMRDRALIACLAVAGLWVAVWS